jgi:hypothetical protein
LPTTIYAGQALFAYLTLEPGLADESSAIRHIDEWHLDVGNAFRHFAVDFAARLGQPCSLP